MVAKITIPRRLLAALNYNEKKVQKGKAEILSASGYLKSVTEMNFYEKLRGQENRNMLNDRAETKTIHVSLNFDPCENLSNNTLNQIAFRYMEKIGFRDQPFLVYRHLDAGHPHLHIVSTLIREDGSRINTHNIGKDLSEKARKELEVHFRLVRAEDQCRLLKANLKPLEAQKIIYGKEETKKSISTVVRSVRDSYQFTSLAELNAILRQFNVLADRGKENGRIFKHHGLVYRILDERGEKVGVPIKASSLPFKPTLINLEKRFLIHAKNREQFRNSLTRKIDEAFCCGPSNLQELISTLEKTDVFTLLRKSKDGRLYGITFVDNETRCVFNGSDLGREYSASSIQNRLARQNRAQETNSPEKTGKSFKTILSRPSQQFPCEKRENQTCSETLVILSKPVQPNQEWIPSELLRKKKKRRKRNLDL